MSRTRVCLFVFGVWTLFVGAGAWGASPPASAPATAPGLDNGRQAAKWHYYGTIDSFPCAVGPRSLWFGGYDSQSLVRYDTGTGQTLSFTPLDGLPLEAGCLRRLVVGADETAVMLPATGAVAYEWKAGRGWRALPVIAQAKVTVRILDVAFAEDGRLLALVLGGVYRLGKGGWEFVRKVPKATNMIPVEGGLFLLGTWTKGEPIRAKFLSLEGSEEATPIYLKQDFNEAIIYYRLGKHVVVLMGSERAGAVESDTTAYAVTADGLKEIGEGFGEAVDLKAGRVWHPQVEDTGKGTVVIASGAPHSMRLELPRERYHELNLFRDQHGDTWEGHRRWDGRKWRPLKAPWTLPEGVRPWDVLGGRLKLDAKCQWHVIDPRVPLDVVCYDSASRTGWRWKDGRHDSLELVVFDAQGKATVKRQFTSPGGAPFLPMLVDSRGNWWMSYGERTRAIARLAPDGSVKTYDLKDPSPVHIAPGGTVWVKSGADPYLRFDAQADAWKKGDMRDAFAAKVGVWTLANIPGFNGGYDEGTLYRKNGEKWEPFPDPFGRTSTVMSFPRMFFKDRMMVSSMGTLCEYDVKNDRWVYLRPGAARPMFDSQGRRIMVDPDGVMVLEGDPFVVAGQTEKDADQMSNLLKLMDNDTWRVRDDATAAMKRQYKNRPDRLRAVLKNKDLSLEVRARVQDALKALETMGGLSGTMPVKSLLRRMYPLVGP